MNDNSTDNSLRVLYELKKKHTNLIVAKHKERKGQTGCFKTGFSHARGEYTIVFDSDLQLYPEDLPLFFEKINQGYDVVNAIRENRQHPFWIKLASRIYNVLMLVLFNCPVLDAASNFTAMRTEYVKDVNLINNDHRYLIPILQLHGAKKIGEVVVRHKRRLSGKSKYSALTKYIKGVPELFISYLRIKSGGV